LNRKGTPSKNFRWDISLKWFLLPTSNFILGRLVVCAVVDNFKNFKLETSSSKFCLIQYLFIAALPFFKGQNGWALINKMMWTFYNAVATIQIYICRHMYSQNSPQRHTIKASCTYFLHVDIWTILCATNCCIFKIFWFSIYLWFIKTL